ncbi:hemoglobin/transferrin/lactoferrin receptor protein [Devosia crocina]|uniref:Hemoglobin/transferrin/lactoferrin receptor protein n=1 Tax=Devosia crocina TaxID=429728 RepID=A0A1I7NUV5_9HYPH|nr:TonB-dependent receptor [Devosia crocina]SFV38368.1 hemoglobin/transferrin/lactoferrin receptor protein [Devosia crocina]
MGLVRSRAAALLGGVALAIVAQQGAQAQNVNATNITILERLVIGAGTPKIAIDTPQAVTVINQADIDQLQAATTGELFANVPGVTVVGSQRQFGEAFNIRGIGTTENSSDGSRVIINIDGTPKFNEQYRMGSFFSDPELYKQVEVLRGPASSTLYGAGALGGVINFTTKDASDFIRDGQTGALRVKGGFDSNGSGTLTSAVLAQQVTDTFEVLAAGNWRRRDDVTQANGNVLDGSDFNTLSGLIKGTAHFGDNDEQKLSVSYQRWQSTADDQAYAQTGTNAVFGVIDREVIDQTAVLVWENPATDNPWVDLNVRLSYSDTTNDQTNHRAVLGGPPTVVGAVVPGVGRIEPDNILLDTRYGYKTFQLSADNTVEWITDDFENYLTFGAQGSTQERSVVRPDNAGPLPAHPQGTENKLGIFAQNELNWDRLTVIAGARGDFHWVNSTTGAPDIDGAAFSPKIAAHYEVTENFGVFASLAHTERLPTIDELYSVAAAGPRGAAKGTSLGLEKESANTIEGGFSLSGNDLIASGDSAALKTTAFYSDLTNLIASNTASPPGGPVVPYYGNIGKAQIYGIEVEASYDSELLFASLAYGLTIGDDLVRNTPLTTVPQNKLALTMGVRNIEYNFDVGARLTLADEGRYVVAAGPFGADGPAEGYATVDLFASWKPDTGPLAGTELQLGIDNLFDTDFRQNLSIDRSTGRTFKVTLAKQFDW